MPPFKGTWRRHKFSGLRVCPHRGGQPWDKRAVFALPLPEGHTPFDRRSKSGGGDVRLILIFHPPPSYNECPFLPRLRERTTLPSSTLLHYNLTLFCGIICRHGRLAKSVERLTALQARRASKPGLLSDGKGLCLRVGKG